MRKLLNWLDDNILFVLSLILLVFIPLYPKLPLLDILPGYVVRLRLEDLLVAAAALVYVVWWCRRRVNPFKNPLVWLVAAYLGAGLLSGLSAIFISKTIPLEGLHIGKWALHWARRVEYIFLLFLLYDSIKTKKQIRMVLSLLMLVVVAAAVYGLGQKYYQWPVYSTMNREFAKGWRLVLTEHARVPSTFAGHYDLGAYLVMAIPISLGLALMSQERLMKVFGWVGFLMGYMLLILTAARSSFISYLATVVILFGMLWFKGQKWRYLLPRFLLVLTYSFFLFATFGDLSGRFTQLVNLSGVRRYIENGIFNMDETVPQAYLTLTDQLALVADKSDTPPVLFEDEATPGARGLPPEVYEEIPDYVSSISATGSATITAKPRSYSEAAFAYGLSSAIRFDALWPRAIKGFKKNPILGSGYSTLTKVNVGDFTEAESTDNDYLRALGETGLLGFGLFFGLIGYGLMLIWRARVKDGGLLGLQAAMLGGVVGLLINASYIDVFEASKVAFTFWAMLGVTLSALTVTSGRKS